MPLIQVQVIKDVFNKEQKLQIISKLTDAMVSIEGENIAVTFCLVEEVESGDSGDRWQSNDHRRRPRPGGWQGCVIRAQIAPRCARTTENGSGAPGGDGRAVEQ